MVAPAYLATALDTGRTGASTNWSLVIPPETVDGTIALVALGTTASAAIMTTVPAGWTLVDPFPVVQGSTTKAWLYIKALTTAEAGTTVTWICDTSGRPSADMYVASVADLDTPLDAVAIDTYNNATNWIAPAVVTDTADCLVIRGYVVRVSTGTPPTTTTPAGHTERGTAASALAAGANSRVTLVEIAAPTPGTQAQATGTQTAPASGVVWTIALRPVTDDTGVLNLSDPRPGTVWLAAPTTEVVLGSAGTPLTLVDTAGSIRLVSPEVNVRLALRVVDPRAGAIRAGGPAETITTPASLTPLTLTDRPRGIRAGRPGQTLQLVGVGGMGWDNAAAWDNADPWGDEGVTGDLVLTDRPRGIRLGKPGQLLQLGLTLVDRPRSIRAGRPAETLTLALTLTDRPGAIRVGAPTQILTTGLTLTDRAGAIRGGRTTETLSLLGAELTLTDRPGAIRAGNPGQTLELGAPLTLTDRPGAIRLGQPGQTLTTGLALTDTPAAIRVGAPPTTITTGLMLNDRPGGVRVGAPQPTLELVDGFVAFVDPRPGVIRVGKTAETLTLGGLTDLVLPDPRAGSIRLAAPRTSLDPGAGRDITITATAVDGSRYWTISAASDEFLGVRVTANVALDQPVLIGIRSVGAETTWYEAEWVGDPGMVRIARIFVGPNPAATVQLDRGRHRVGVKVDDHPEAPTAEAYRMYVTS